MAKTIKIQSGSQVISIESDDAGVPDVTEGTGPDLLALQDDAMASPNEENAEFNAAIDDSAVESEDKPQSVEEVAAESFFDALFSAEDGEEAAVTGDEPAPEQSDTPVTPDETPAEDTGDGEGDGAGEVTEGDGVTTIDTGDTVITISNSDDAATDETPAEEPAAEEPAETSTEEAPAEPEQNTDQAIESFFHNLGL